MSCVIKRIMSLILLVIIFLNVLLLSSCSLFEKTPYEKLITLRETLMTKEKFKEKIESFNNVAEKDRWVVKYADEIKELLFDLGIGITGSINDDDIVAKSNETLKLTKSDIQRYIEEYSVEDLMKLAMNLRTTVDNELDNYRTADKKALYMPTIYNVFVEWCIELKPEEFLKLSDLKENSTTGFYSEHKDADPVPRTEKVTISYNQYVYNMYNVTYYGDFAVQESIEYKYDQGVLGWEDGEFIDIPSGYKSEVFYSLYYKGKQVDIINKGANGYVPKSGDKNFFYIYIPKNENYINYMFKSDRGLVWFQHSYFETN